MNEVFISDEEVETYEKKSDPARRSVVWSLAAVAAAFVLVGGAYLFGTLGGGAGELTASLFGNQSEEGEVFALRSSGGADNRDVAPAKRDAGSAACGYESGAEPKRGGVLISEVAWMGTEEGAQYEWIEIANTGSMPVNIGGWSLVDKDEQIQVTLPKNASIPAGGFFLLARSTDRVGSVRADVRYTGNLKNEGEGLKLFNEKCDVVDEVFAAPEWPAGESVERRTMERNLVTRAWYTSSVAGGTPRAQNSLNASQRKASGEHFASQNVLAATSTVAAEPAAQPSAQGTVVISEVMAGKDGAANWDFVELHNLESTPVLLTGWSMKKRTASGSESSLVSVKAKDLSASFEGKTIPVGGYFLLAHPDYTGEPPANIVWPKSYTLAYSNNAVVIYNANGEKVSEVSWSEIPKGQSYAVTNGIWAVAAPTPGRP